MLMEQGAHVLYAICTKVMKETDTRATRYRFKDKLIKYWKIENDQEYTMED